MSIIDEKKDPNTIIYAAINMLSDTLYSREEIKAKLYEASIIIDEYKKCLKEWEPVIWEASYVSHKYGWENLSNAYEAISEENIPTSEKIKIL